ncbi:hypothetical protein [Thalassobacillus sp. CUG 92003]|uniref:hypothetical protein n=1 Tax=Thalassobacillus sp. CUG 92003 TaxID=2736641 RepID=UPI0015E7A33A|nr:hypothetical protein [Thalassobacillus sp. CUG 92003]
MTVIFIAVPAAFLAFLVLYFLHSFGLTVNGTIFIVSTALLVSLIGVVLTMRTSLWVALPSMFVLMIALYYIGSSRIQISQEDQADRPATDKSPHPAQTKGDLLMHHPLFRERDENKESTGSFQNDEESLNLDEAAATSQNGMNEAPVSPPVTTTGETENALNSPPTMDQIEPFDDNELIDSHSIEEEVAAARERAVFSADEAAADIPSEEGDKISTAWDESTLVDHRKVSSGTSGSE